MNRKNSRKSRTLQIESLESRQLMAADIDFQDGVVEIDGTNRADQVEVSYAGSKYIRVTVNGETDKFRRSKVDEIRFVGHSGNDTFKNRTNIDSVVDGGGGNDRLIGGSGDDRLDGGSGNDTIYGKAGRDRIKGGSGNDRLFGGSGRDTLDGNKGADYLSGGGSADVLKGRGGNDTLHGGDGRDTLYGGSGDDRLYGGDGQDELHGEDGNDRLEGGHDNDSLKGGDGHDTLKGEHGSDHLMGGNGNDKLYGGTGKDELEGGKGRDHLNGGDGDDILKGRSGRDSLYGADGHDELWGGSGDDYLNGGDGQDQLHGGKDNDVLDGGDDGIVRDSLWGDEGEDQFVWHTNDLMRDQQPGELPIYQIDTQTVLRGSNIVTTLGADDLEEALANELNVNLAGRQDGYTDTERVHLRNFRVSFKSGKITVTLDYKFETRAKLGSAYGKNYYSPWASDSGSVEIDLSARIKDGVLFAQTDSDHVRWSSDNDTTHYLVNIINELIVATDQGDEINPRTSIADAVNAGLANVFADESDLAVGGEPDLGRDGVDLGAFLGKFAPQHLQNQLNQVPTSEINGGFTRDGLVLWVSQSAILGVWP